MGTKKILLQACIIAAIILGTYTACDSQPTESAKPALVIFHSEGCHSCMKVRQEIIPKIEKRYKDKITLEYREIDNIENYTLLLSLKEKYGVTLTTGSWPVFYMRGYFINGYDNIKSGWERFIDKALGPTAKEEPDILPPVDLLARFKSFTPAIIIGVAFIDGVNPCAFTVIVFFMSFMALQGYKKRELVGIGLGFISAVFITYLLIGLGAFGILYRLSHFWLLVKIINYMIGTLSVILGALAVYDFFKYLKTGQAEGMVLQLPKSIKNRIHKVIGLFGRVVNKSTGVKSTRKSSYGLIASAFITGFLVSLLEAVCTGQVYLPTISFILKTSPLKLQAMGYLLLYNLAFTIPILIVFVFAVFGVTSERFSKFIKKYLLVIKFFMAVLFFGFGIFLIWRA